MQRTDRLVILPHLYGEQGHLLAGSLPPAIFGLDEDHLSFPNPLAYELRISRTGDDLLLRGQSRTTARCRCDRCLQYFDLELRCEDLCRVYQNVTEEGLDVTEDLREDVLILLPQKFLCQAACRGLCRICGQNLNVRACACTPPPAVAGQWDQLDELKL